MDAIDLDVACTRILTAIQQRRQGYVCVTGVHGVMEANRDPSFRRILNQSMLTTPDGMPMVWIGRLQGHRGISRVYGPDLMLALCRRTISTGHSHFLFGGAPGVAEALRDQLTRRFPGLRIVGTFTPPFRPMSATEQSALENGLRIAAPDILWVGLSTPKQERFMASSLGRLTATVMIGVGAAFDIHSGRVRQAPRWMQRSGLEWLFRLLQEPRRLWRRYLVNNPLFVWSFLVQYLCARRYRTLSDMPVGESGNSDRALPTKNGNE